MMGLDLSGFAAFLALNDRRQSTIQKHINSLKIISGHLSDFNKVEIDKMFASFKLQEKSPRYLNSLVNSIRLYAQYINGEESLQKYRQFKEGDTLKATLSDDEIEQFLNMSYPKGACKESWDFWTKFFSICAFTGMRPGEVAHLTKEDIDFGRGVIVIRQSKTNTPGVAPIPPNIKEMLQILVTQTTGNFLFPSKQGGMGKSGDGLKIVDNVDWHYNFHKRIKLLGIKRSKLSPYSFRHSFATRLLEENVSLFHVKKLMRHSDLKSTLVYEHLTTKDLCEAIEKLPLVRKGTDPKHILLGLVEALKAFHFEQDIRLDYSINIQPTAVSFTVKLKDII